jgi:hypothetical protein
MAVISCPRVLETTGETRKSPLETTATLQSAHKLILENIRGEQNPEESRRGVLLRLLLPLNEPATDGILRQCDRPNPWYQREV